MWCCSGGHTAGGGQTAVWPGGAGDGWGAGRTAVGRAEPGTDKEPGGTGVSGTAGPGMG